HPRAELSDWADERAQLLVDPEQGPNWHIGVLPFTDGSTAVSLVSSHCVVDGLGVGVAVAEAISGIRRDLGYAPPRSRTWLRAVAEDGCRTVRGLPDVGRAIVAAVKDLRRRKDASDTSGGSQPVAVAAGSGDERVIVPMVMVHVDEDDWDTRAKALGGMSHHLVAGFAAEFGGRMRRRRSRDGKVTVQLPISERTETDTRANALSFVSITVDPAQVTTSLHQIRIASRQAFKTMREKPDDTAQINAQTAAVPFVPRRLLARIADAAYAYDDLPVGCSNAGDIGAALGRPDGTAAAFGSVRGGEQRVTRGHLERTRGQLVLWVVRFGGKICITAAGYQPGAVTTKTELRGLVAQTLADFDLTGVVT
ncbi:MAG: hypothetical protein ACRDU4_16360, partial [Mycobacterium sp.]